MSNQAHVITIETKSLGDRSYVVVADGEAAVVDPQRDIDRVLAILDEHGATLTHVLETHVHNDYVTGGLELARRAGASYVVAAADEVAYERTPASEGDEFRVGGAVLRAVHTPGHTPNHLSYVLMVDGEQQAVFSGGSMLFGTVGRTDLIAPEATEPLTRAQYHSVRRLGSELDPAVAVNPTHGFGSFCSSGSSSGADTSTVADERKANTALTTEDEDTFVKELLAGLTAYPGYYAHMAPLNRTGPSPVDLSPPEVAGPSELRRRIDAGEWVVDLRSRKDFAHDHLVGTVNVEGGDSFVTYLGWTMPWGTPVTLVGDTAEDVAEAQRQMARIGIDRPAAVATGGVAAWAGDGPRSSYRSVPFADLAAAYDDGEVQVLDVRRDDEWAESHIEGALHIPLFELEQRMDEVPADTELWVHCESGYRAAIGASLLDRAGRAVVAIDDNWGNAAKHPPLPVVSER